MRDMKWHKCNINTFSFYNFACSVFSSCYLFIAIVGYKFNVASNSGPNWRYFTK